MTTGFVTATKRQLPYKPDTMVRDHFSPSPLFRYGLAYCEAHYDQTFVLCIGTNQLLHPDSTVGDVDLERGVKDPDYRTKKNWLRDISNQIKEHCPQESELYFHTPKWYFQLFKWLNQPHLLTQEPARYTLIEAVKSMSIGKRLHFYKQEVGQLPSYKSKETI